MCGVRREEDVGQNLRKSNGRETRNTPAEEAEEQRSRKKTRTGSWKPREVSITRRRYCQGLMLLRSNKVKTKKCPLDLARTIDDLHKRNFGEAVGTQDQIAAG